MSSRREDDTNTTSAHLARRGALSTAERPPVHFYDTSLDGLFTYCLSVMCEHDAAVAALGEALAVAERQRARDRAPADTALHRPWLYALARWSCLRRLSATTGRPEPPRLTGPEATRRRGELASLAWPEAAGTTPEQREALELAVRHQLPVHEVAAVLNLSSETARTQLSSAACEVERTRAALAVVDAGGCPAVAGLARDHEVLLGTALRRELVRHVDECTVCRLAAERAMASQPWPGTATLGTGTLAVVEAPRPEVNAAMSVALRARMLHTPRFNRRGFPVELKDRQARRERIRSRAVTTTVVATVVAAPVLALWAAYRGVPLPGDNRDGPVSAAEAEDRELHTHPYENAGRAGRTAVPGGGPRDGGGPGTEVSVEAKERADEEKSADGRPSPSPSAGGQHERPGGHTGGSTSPGPGRITVSAQPTGDATLITLTASGGSAVDWSAHADAGWLRLSRHSGTLHPGESVTIRVTVDRHREPPGDWSARIHIAPAQAVITVQGRGREPDPGPSDPGPSDPDPSPSDPAPGPSDPDPGGA
ncbi:sigma-70 family RNA polymerase sigma factor [Streptomyces sp. 549]|uniref:BACON domain-containing protein n=1 Tax=Streptomyces sp. 549 TaxID=3049076 RepID=UPI0024C27E51|nr:sigma-70 family RNA polymerase sigma factor [Streptomyces sp. 549]MDK1472367.1 sigma-70 family RNA polymerase sigma factor [Streptomyces sp. 549]